MSDIEGWERVGTMPASIVERPPETYSFESELAEAEMVVVCEGRDRLSETLVGWPDLEAFVADVWPRVTGHLLTACDLGTCLEKVRDPVNWIWRSGRPVRFAIAQAQAEMDLRLVERAA